MTEARIEECQQSQRPSQRSQRPTRPKRLISGPRRTPFTMHLPKSTVSAEEVQNQRKRLASQREIEESTVNLVKQSLGEMTKSESHAKKFKKEIDESTAIPLLLQEHLGWVSKLPSSAQLLTLIGEKWLRTRL